MKSQTLSPREPPWYQKYSTTLVKDGNTFFMQDHQVGWNGILQWGRKIGLNSKFSRGKWEFIAKQQGGSQWTKALRGNIRESKGKSDKGFLLNEDRSRWSGMIQVMVEDEEPGQTLGLLDSEERVWGFWLNWFSKVPGKMKFYKEVHRWA